MPLGMNPRLTATWKPIMEKIKKRLAPWKRRYISFGGRVTLIKSVLNSLPIYYMSLFKVPSGVVKEIEMTQANFLWGGAELKRKLHMVSWANITQDKKQGGLGIRSVKEMNESLLLKWWWRFGMEKDALWRKVIVAKYKLEEGSWSLNREINNKMSILWKDIILVHERQPNMFSKFVENVKFKVGDGRNILFWKDNWLNESCLVVLYPTIFRLINCKDETLWEVLARKEEYLQWDFQFRRRLYQWEEVTLMALYDMLDRRGATIANGGADQLTWAACNSNKYTSMYHLSKGLDSSNIVFDFIWKNVAPHRVQCFGWLTQLGRVKTSLYLYNLGIIQNLEDVACKFCNLEHESLDHLLLHCQFVWELWSEVLSWWDIQWVVPQNVNALFIWWMNCKIKSSQKIIWNCIPLAVIWSIWNMRNNHIF